MPPTELGWYMKYVYQHEVVKLGVSSLCLLHLTDELNSENIRFTLFILIKRLDPEFQYWKSLIFSKFSVLMALRGLLFLKPYFIC